VPPPALPRPLHASTAYLILSYLISTAPDPLARMREREGEATVGGTVGRTVGGGGAPFAARQRGSSAHAGKVSEPRSRATCSRWSR